MATVGAAATMDSSASAAGQQPAPATIPPVRAWNPNKDTFTPYFPYGWYSFGPSAQIKELAANGANTALYAGLGIHDWQRGDALEQMDIAHELGVKLILGLRGSVVGRIHFGKPDSYSVVPQYVDTFNHHPAMLGW